MKKFPFFLLVLFCVSFIFGQKIERVKQFGENPGKLRMFQYVPAKLDTSTPCPLVLVLHGSWQTAKTLSRCSGWNKLADSLNFIVLYPDQPVYNNLLTAFSFYMPSKMEKGRGETASIRRMIDHMLETYSIDPSQVFIVGMSAGGAMANVMLNVHPEYFNAAVFVAAPSMLQGDLNGHTQHVPRVAIIQGESDMTVQPKNAGRIIIQWTTKHDLDPEAYTNIEGYQGHPELRVRTYDKAGETVLLRMDIAKTGHLLLIDPGESLQQGGKSSLFSKDIDFHLPYWIMEFFGLVSKRMR